VAGYARWQAFRNEGLRSYAKRRNEIEVDGVSRMSAYLHYGMVSPFRIAREASADRAEKYLDELLIWRELAYCFCYFRNDLDSDSSLPRWARITLLEHQHDPRTEKSWETLARARSGSRLWDAAQRSLLKHGELHNNVRMTWGKAILEWSKDHPQALERLIDLNHRYALDGRDPASYGGILWCLGQFDRPFFPKQPIFGNVRPRPIHVHEQRTNVEAYEQRVDRALVNPSPRIAMIGAGLGGLMCSRILQDHALDVRLFDKSRRSGGRATTRITDDGIQFDHGAQYFTIRDPGLRRYLESWISDKHVAEWQGHIVAIEEAGKFNELAPLQRYVGTPSMESLAHHLAADLSIQFETEVERALRSDRGYQLLGSDDRSFGEFDIVLWNCPPIQTRKQIPPDCDWQARLTHVEMVPCWAVMIATESRWDIPVDGAFVNQGNLSWIARDSSKPARPSGLETWVLHSTVNWANEHLETPKEQVAQDLIADAERVTGSLMPGPCFTRAHRWLYSRPAESLPESSLWDETNWLGACGDWCGGPRVEGALRSGISLSGRVLGALHESSSTQPRSVKTKQLSLFNELSE
jgi:predicted NAD/FAD-dependent oxidoreductase